MFMTSKLLQALFLFRSSVLLLLHIIFILQGTLNCFLIRNAQVPYLQSKNGKNSIDCELCTDQGIEVNVSVTLERLAPTLNELELVFSSGGGPEILTFPVFAPADVLFKAQAIP